MRFVISLKFAAVAVIAGFTLAAQAQPVAGNEGGHGGDHYAFEFYQLIQEILKELSAPETAELNARNGVDLERLRLIIAKPLLIYSAEGEDVKIGEQEVAAINNFPQSDRILLNRTMWRAAKLDQKLKVVVHELFGLLGLELDTYNVSYKYVRVMEKTYLRLLDANAVTSPVRYYGLCIGSPPLYAQGDVCDPKHPFVAAAVDCARAQAMMSCLSEKPGACSVIDTAVASVQKAHVQGFRYCEVTALVK